MQFCLATDQHRAIFQAWNRDSRLEERTCRPIVDGKRVAPDNRVVTLAFFQEDTDQSELVGRFVYFDINPRNRSAEFGYIVSPECRNQGLGTKMLTQALDHLFSTTELNKLYCQTAAFNTASIKPLEKLGFQKEGSLREHHELAGKLWDDSIYSMLKREWLAPERIVCKPTVRRWLEKSVSSPLNDYTIRPYTPADETQWLRCRVLAFLDSAYFDDVKRAKPQYNNPSIALVATNSDDTVIGFIDIECETVPGTVCADRPGLGGMIWDLGVHPDYRRQGVAKALLNRAIAVSKQHALVRLEAWTRDDPATVAWYRSQGFQRIEGYLHVYLEREEARQTLTSTVPGIKPVCAFTHCSQADKFEALRSQFHRVHDCQLFELRLS